MEQTGKKNMEMKPDYTMLERYFSLHHGLNFTKDQMETIMGIARQGIIFNKKDRQSAETVLEDTMKISSTMPLSSTQKHFILLAMQKYANQFKPEFQVRETGSMPVLDWIVNKVRDINKRFRKRSLVDMKKYSELENKYS